VTYSREAVLAVIEALNHAGARYLLTGALATNVYAEPRSTKDADFVVEMSAVELENLLRALQPAFAREPQMAFETATGKSMHRLRYRRTPFLVEIFEAMMTDPHEAARFERRVPTQVEGLPTFVPTAEDIIVQKLRWISRLNRAKDRQDVVTLIRYRRHRLDWPYLYHWCERHNTRDAIDRFQAEADANPIEGP
jgi:hypothetical protein